MTDQEFYQQSHDNYEALAAKLVADGFERRDWQHSHIPATFHKIVHGKERVFYLVTDFGSTKWGMKLVDPVTRARKGD